MQSNSCLICNKDLGAYLLLPFIIIFNIHIAVEPEFEKEKKEMAGFESNGFDTDVFKFDWILPFLIMKTKYIFR